MSTTAKIYDPTQPLPADVDARIQAAKSVIAPPESTGPLPVVGSGGVVGPLAARHWKAPFRYDAEGAIIWDANNKRALDVRGWGYLTGKGALGLSADEAEKITAEFGQSVVRILNAQWPNDRDVPTSG